MPSIGGIYVGMGGWNYPPWRETFYPANVKPAAELEYASRQVTAIEINSTFYRLQKPAVFAKWRDATPPGFVFCVKAPRFITQRKVLAEGLTGIERFVQSGLHELQDKLGVILWQFAPTHEFKADDVQAFLAGLPRTLHRRPLRHVLNVRHESFRDAHFIALLRARGIGVVYEDDDRYPAIADVTSDFVYARLRRSIASEPTGYPRAMLKQWAQRARRWASGAHPDDLPRIDQSMQRTGQSAAARDVFVFFINGAKERAPSAARELLSLLQD